MRRNARDKARATSIFCLENGTVHFAERTHECAWTGYGNLSGGSIARFREKSQGSSYRMTLDYVLFDNQGYSFGIQIHGIAVGTF